MKATRTRLTARRKKKLLPPIPPSTTEPDSRTPPMYGIPAAPRQPEADASIEDALEDWPESGDSPDEWMVERDAQRDT